MLLSFMAVTTPTPAPADNKQVVSYQGFWPWSDTKTNPVETTAPIVKTKPETAINNKALYSTCIWTLKSSEGLRLEEYRCAANRRTIGWGHLLEGKPNPGKIDVRTADVLFKDDFRKVWDWANKEYPHLHEEGRWAMALFAFNLGTSAVGKSLQRSLTSNPVNYKAAAFHIKKYNKARRHKKNCSMNCRSCPLKEYRGLTKKREFEAALLLQDYDTINKERPKAKKAVKAKIAKAIKLAE